MSTAPAIPAIDVRVCALPLSTLHGLRFSTTVAQLTQVEEQRNKIDDLSRELDASLHQEIGNRDPEDPKRTQLIKARRAVRRGKLLSGVELNDLDLVLCDHAQKLAATKRETESLLVDVEKSFTEDYQRTALALNESVMNPLVQNGILCSAPTLEEQISRNDWMLRKLGNKSLTHIAQFVYRATSKTSPYSTFTLTGNMAVGQGRPEPSVETTRVVRQIDGRLWAAVLFDVMSRPETRELLSWRTNPSLTELNAEQRYVYLGPPPGEQFRQTPHHPLVQFAIKLERYSYTLSSLYAEMANALGVTTQVARDGVEVLIDRGVIIPDSPVPDGSLFPLSSLSDWIEKHGLTGAIEYAPILRSIASQIQLTPVLSGAGTHREERANLLNSIGRLNASIEIQGVQLTGDALTLHESAVQFPPIAVPSTPTDEDLENLAVVRTWLSVHDIKLPGRIAVEQFAFDRHQGDEVPILQLYREVSGELQHGVGELADHLRTWFSATPRTPDDAMIPSKLNLPMRMLFELRQAGEDLVAAHIDENTGVSSIPREALLNAVAEAPQRFYRDAPAAAYIQESHAQNERWVLNVLHGGYGRGRARTHFQIVAAGGAPAALGVDHPSNVLPAEYSGVHGSSLNERLPVLDVAIDYPYTHPAQGIARVRVGDLRARVDLNTGKLLLFDKSGERCIVPAHVGMLADYQLPPLARFIERVFGDSFLLHPSNPPFASRLKLSELTGVTHFPRISVSGIVVRRARWIFSKDSFPWPDSSESRPEYWLRLREWRCAEEIPGTVFVRSWGSDLRKGKAKSRKPMLLDFDSWWTISELVRQKLGTDFVVIDEALPNPFSADVDAYTTELLIEVPAMSLLKRGK